MSNDKLVWAVKNGSLEEVKKIVEVSDYFSYFYGINTYIT